ncbi:MAG: AAA family ATPase [Candidatus Riflebacteria bacterium]|nr:AAA family ATPase [Candidatus Riflebacteria bacterium]
MGKITDFSDKYKIELSKKQLSDAFEELVSKIYERDGKVVILIDEYDKPILNNIENENIAELQKVMKGFYSVLKTCEPYERFVFITGVGKFLKVSIFSDLNNLTDISMSDDYAIMCGYTEKELLENFHSQILETSKHQKIEYEIFLQKIKKWYDGYKFSIEGKNVYNPVSFAKFIENHGYFKNYWFETGSPSILVKLFKSQTFDISEALKENYQKEIFTAFEPSRVSIIALMYQTGYLTIKNVKTIRNINRYELDFPNFEVEDSFNRYLLTSVNNRLNAADSVYLKICDAVDENNVDKMMVAINSFQKYPMAYR